MVLAPSSLITDGYAFGCRLRQRVRVLRGGTLQAMVVVDVLRARNICWSKAS